MSKMKGGFEMSKIKGVGVFLSIVICNFFATGFSLEKDLIFYCEYDEKPEAIISMGNPIPTNLKEMEKIVSNYLPGIKGKSVVSEPKGVAYIYEIDKNIDFTKGTLSIWIQPLDWPPLPKSGVFPLFITYADPKKEKSVYMGLQIEAGGNLRFFVHDYGKEETIGKHSIISGNPKDWKKGEWHNVVITWNIFNFSLFVDGEVQGGIRLKAPLLREYFGSIFRIGSNYDVMPKTAIDEVRIYNRAFSPEEVKEFYKTYLNMKLTQNTSQTEISYSDYVVRLPKMRNPPIIDGIIGEREWDDATRIEGFTAHSSGYLEPRKGYFYLGYDQQHLYFAVITEIPLEGTLISREKQPSKVVYDDAIEIWIDPNRFSKGKEQRYYQFMINSIGTVFCQSFDRTNPQTPQSWQGKWDFANRIDNGFWIMESSISFKELNANPISQDISKSWGIFIARDWKQPFVFSGWKRGGVAGFSDWNSYPLLIADENAPVVQLLFLGNIYQGKTNLLVSIKNPHPFKQKVKVLANLQPSNLPEVVKEEIIPLDSYEEKVFQLSKENIPEAENFLSIKVTSVDERKVFFAHSLKWKPPRKEIWQVEGSLKNNILEIAYYPYYNKLKAKVWLISLPETSKVKEAKIEIFNSEGKLIGKGSINSFRDKNGEVIIDLPDLPDGEYQVIATLVGEGIFKEIAKKSFKRKHFIWEHNNLGISDEVIPPFEPLKLKDKEVYCLYRTYQMNKFGLWDRVITKGVNILFAPMVIKFVSEGEEGKWNDGKISILESKPNVVKVKSEVGVDNLEINTISSIEYDGCMKVEMEIKGKNKKIDHLWIEIPLKDEFCPLMHVVMDGIRSNPAGKVPSGKGIIFDGKNLPRRSLLGMFVPYIWIGEEERGLCWFADNDKGWVVDDEKPSLTLERKEKVLFLNIHLINKSILLTENRKIIFGLMATPVKPRPEGWRTWDSWKNEGHKFLSWHFFHGQIAPGPYPLNYDLSVWDEWIRAKETGKFPNEYYEKWMKMLGEYLGDKKDLYNESYKNGYYHSHLYGFFQNALQKVDIFMPCLDSFEIWVGHPEFHIFQDEWDLEEYSPTSRHHIDKIKTFDDKYKVVRVEPVKSFLDWTTYYVNEKLKRGIGNYIDNYFPKPNYDPIVSDAYYREDGKIQPSVGIWSLRERMKRMAILHYQYKNPGLMVHMTNGNIVPVLSFAPIQLDWEWKYGRLPFQERFSPDLIRAESMGTQTGTVPFVLYGIYDVKNKEEEKFIQRTLWGVTSIHEIKVWGGIGIKELEKIKYNFGYGLSDCKIYHYWEKDYPLLVKEGELYSIIYQRPKKAMLILVSYEKEDKSFCIKIDSQKLNLSFEKIEIKDIENNEILKLDKTGQFNLFIPKYGVKILEILQR
ncbi:MAG: DUF6067 family protein [Candidatus Omnitrophica bacterium]|nr:DUF6067 family protein [Candidatus Omnitrophota bacterium]